MLVDESRPWRNDTALLDARGGFVAGGNVALTLTDLGGSICDDDRDIVEEWLWRKPLSPSSASHCSHGMCGLS